MTAERKEIPPPWVEYPGYGPGDTFWRQTGEPFMSHVWEPFYASLSEQAKDAYLAHWSAPEDWRQFYFDKTFGDWLESTDEDN